MDDRLIVLKKLRNGLEVFFTTISEKPGATIVILSDIGGENTGDMLCKMMANIPNTR